MMNKSPLSLALCLCALLLTACGDSDSTPEAVFTQCEDQAITRGATKADLASSNWSSSGTPFIDDEPTALYFEFHTDGTYLKKTRIISSCPYSNPSKQDTCVQVEQGTYTIDQGLVTLTSDERTQLLQVNRLYSQYGACKSSSGYCRIELSSDSFCNQQFIPTANEV